MDFAETINTATIYLQRYLIVNPFIIPLGVIGLWRWFTWALKEIIALRYQPQSGSYKATVSIITPVYNENPHIFYQALTSWAKNNPQEIIAVIDSSDTKSIEVFKNFQKKFPKANLIITSIPGKREALAEGIKAAKNEILALVDSDTIWSEDLIINAVIPFQDALVGGVSTSQNILNPKTLAQKIFDVQLNLRYSDDYPFMAASGPALSCLSGRTAFYRQKVILPLTNDLVNETFLGQKVISGDDKRLTYLVAKQGWKLAYQNNAKVYTPGMAGMGQFFKQKLRWSRNSFRADLRALKDGWPFHYPALAFFQIDRIIQPFFLLLSPIFFFLTLFFESYTGALVIFIWWLISRTVRIYPHLKKRPQDIILLPVFIIFSFMAAIIKIYALFTLNIQGWITRWDKSRISPLRFLPSLPGYLGTIFTILFLSGGAYFYERQSFILPRLAQEERTAFALPFQTNLALAAPKKEEIHPLDKRADLSVRRYTIKDGDSLGSIAREQNISLDDLLGANISKVTNWNNLAPGTILSIPGKDLHLTLQNNFNYQRIYPDILQISYDTATDTILVSGRGEEVTLNDIQRAVGEKYLVEEPEKIWLLKANLFLRSGTTLKLTREEVAWLKLQSNQDKYINLRGFNATVLVDGVQITSWDDQKNNFDEQLADGRSFILVKDGSRMDLYNADIGYLGFPRTPNMTVSPYGISWRMSNGKLGTTLLTGEIINTKFHHNYFGAYTFGATGMVWRGNEFFNNIRYGLDPHDDSNGFLIENNKFYSNGSHGLILSKRCINNTIINNQSYNNILHGIMLHEKSDYNLLENNIVVGNRDGIALWNSKNNIIRNNNVEGNTRGIRANATSSNNLITDNLITNQKQYGIYLYSFSDNNTITDNNLLYNQNALYIKTAGNLITQNNIEKNSRGIYLLDQAKNNKIDKNRLAYNNSYGIYVKTPKSFQNFLGNNNLQTNLRDIFVR